MHCCLFTRPCDMIAQHTVSIKLGELMIRHYYKLVNILSSARSSRSQSKMDFSPTYNIGFKKFSISGYSCVPHPAAKIKPYINSFLSQCNAGAFSHKWNEYFPSCAGYAFSYSIVNFPTFLLRIPDQSAPYIPLNPILRKWPPSIPLVFTIISYSFFSSSQSHS